MSTTEQFDYTIIGGGIVGIATAWQLIQQQPTSSILLIEKEPALAQHQTSHNSGVIHAGVYYQPGSLKADFCKRGAAATLDFCRQHRLDVKQPGKLIVATTPLEQRRLENLAQRCQQNQIQAEPLNQQQLRAIEPNIAGLSALHVPQSGIVDYRQICHTMAELYQQAGGTLRLNTRLTAAAESADAINLQTDRGSIRSRYVIACAGLMADRVAGLFQLDKLSPDHDFAIIPFRGEYYQLPDRMNELVSHLIYPVPDPALPFLGVHLTPMIDGRITVGPNAVLGWKREGYDQWNLSLQDSLEMLGFAGFWRLSAKQLKTGLSELKNSWFKAAYLKRIQKYCPQLGLQDLQPYPAGIRAQAVLKDGSLVHDFLFAESARSLHVCNAPSPAATSAMPIAEYIVGKLLAKTHR